MYRKQAGSPVEMQEISFCNLVEDSEYIAFGSYNTVTVGLMETEDGDII